jgi:hypothetical protein
MKCPACENDVPSGLSACTRCGAPLPSAGERPGPEPRFATGATQSLPVERPNPRTEPLPVPVWDVGEERPWDLPPDWHEAPGPAPAPPQPGFAAPYAGTPAAHPRPLEYDLAPQYPAGPAPEPAGPSGPVPPPAFDPAFDPAGWGPGAPPVAGDTAAPDGRTGKSRKVPMLACGIAAVVVLGGGLVYALTQGLPWSTDGTHSSGANPGTGSAAQQAAAVNQILRSGRTARGHLPARLRTCADVSSGVPGFQRVVRDRQQELSQSRLLKVDRLPDGTSLRRSMIAAYQSSLDADQAYLAWAREIRARRCGGRIAPLTAHYNDAIAANDKAGPAKRQVVALWKPIASSHGLPTYVWNRL